MPELETRLDIIAAYAARHRDDYAAFGYYIDIMWEREGRADAALDALVNTITTRITPQIDCLACANCCRNFTVGLTPNDIRPLAAALDLSPEDVTHRYINQTAGARQGEWGVFQCSPCPLLAGTFCTGYAHRPQACRAYPALTPHFRWLIKPILADVGECPIIFNVIEHLKEALAW